MQRRTLLALGVAGTAALGLAGGVAWVLNAPAAWRDGALQVSGRRVMRAVALAVLDGALPADAAMQTKALDSHLDRLAAAIGVLPPAVQAEVDQLLKLLASAPGRIALAGLRADWAEAALADLRDALRSMRGSSIGLRRQAFQALRELTHAAYYADPATWSLLGYPGPRATP